jgi:hypothetical protein
MSNKKIAISQSNYIPWRGYFDLINSVDEFIFFDEVQFTRRDWRNRNKILINNKSTWLTIPLENKGNYSEIISNMKVFDGNWKIRHIEIIKKNYSKAKYFQDIFFLVNKLYQQINSFYLSEINQFLIKEICFLLNIKTKFKKSSEFKIFNNRNYDATERLVDLCYQSGCSTYITGPAAKNYLRVDEFKKKDISVIWFDYKDSKIYNQFDKNFIKDLSILDCLFHCNLEKKFFLNT